MSPRKKAGTARSAASRGAPRAAQRQPVASKVPVVLDSSCWLEFFADTAQADLYAAVIDQAESLVVPVITVYEVAKKLAREAGDEVAASALSLMQRGRVIGIDLPLALDAAVNGLPMADSLIYATAQQHAAELWTQDQHFESLPGVRYFPKT